VLLRDFNEGSLPLSYRLCLERRGLESEAESSLSEPPNKKMKIDISEKWSLEEGLYAFNGLYDVIAGRPPLPHFHKLYRERPLFLDCVLEVGAVIKLNCL